MSQWLEMAKRYFSLRHRMGGFVYHWYLGFIVLGCLVWGNSSGVLGTSMWTHWPWSESCFFMAHGSAVSGYGKGSQVILFFLIWCVFIVIKYHFILLLFTFYCLHLIYLYAHIDIDIWHHCLHLITLPPRYDLSFMCPLLPPSFVLSFISNRWF